MTLGLMSSLFILIKDLTVAARPIKLLWLLLIEAQAIYINTIRISFITLYLIYVLGN